MAITVNKPDSLCHADNSVLLIIDVQEKLTRAMPDKVVSRLLRNSSLLLRAASLFDIPVIATEQYPKGLGKLENSLTSLLPQGSSVYEKTAFCCLAVDGLARQLADSDRKQVIMTGVEAHICILQSALELAASDYTVFVVGDAICSRNRENYENALLRLRHAGVNVINTESVLFEWVADASHEHFKEISKLVQSGD